MLSRHRVKQGREMGKAIGKDETEVSSLCSVNMTLKEGDCLRAEETTKSNDTHFC